MTTKDNLTVPEKLLVAAYALDQAGRNPFSAEDLVIQAWKTFPNTFGLGGYRNEHGQLLYPDSNRVFAEIMGSKPIRTRGLLTKVAEKRYALTESGRNLASTLISSGDGAGKSGLSRDSRDRLRSLLASKAVQKVQSDGFEKLTFHDACLFWGITPRSAAVELATSVANVRELVRVARSHLQEGAARFDNRGDGFSSASLDLIEQTHKALLERFSSELRTIEQRRDQRSNKVSR